MVDCNNKEGSPSHVASAATLSVTFMVALSAHALLTSAASGIAFVLDAWQPLQILLSSKMGIFPFVLLLALGSTVAHVSTTSTSKLASQKKSSADTFINSDKLLC
ncbi:hypothetical protein U1Q18_013946, partial [Sarracenia purpurea var. burkii]